MCACDGAVFGRALLTRTSRCIYPICGSTAEYRSRRRRGIKSGGPFVLPHRTFPSPPPLVVCRAYTQYVKRSEFLKPIPCDSVRTARYPGSNRTRPISENAVSYHDFRAKFSSLSSSTMRRRARACAASHRFGRFFSVSSCVIEH